MYSFYFEGYRIRINTADGIIHPMRTEEKATSVSRKKRGGDSPETIKICLECTAERCTGVGNCPLTLKHITTGELDDFKHWLTDNLIDAKTMTYKQASAETGVSVVTLRRLIGGNYPSLGIQQKIRIWIDQKGQQGQDGSR